jgi:Hypothetical protein (DUF2513)
MKRDLDLVRHILFQLEGEGKDSGPSGPSAFGWNAFVEQGHELETIHYHVQLLHDAGLIEANEVMPGQWWPDRMTWAGHEFLDAARNEDLWQETKRRVAGRVGSAPFVLFHETLIRMSRERLERDSA